MVGVEVPVRLVATDIHATYSVRDPFRLPFHSGGMFHGLFGRALRKVACPKLPCCVGPCARPSECDWARLFSPPPREPPPHRLLVGQKEPPGPVVLLIPAPGGAELVAAGAMSFGLRIFGDAAGGDVGTLEKALAQIAEMPIGSDEGRVELRAITRYSPRDVWTPVGANGPGGPRVTVRFETPVRVKRGGEIAADIDFATLFSQVWRRLTMLSALYGEYGEADDATFQRLRAAAATVKVTERRLVPLKWEHLSAETGERKPMRGLIGHVVFEGGSLAELLPALTAGEAVHVGGGTSFGLGRMRVEMGP